MSTHPTHIDAAPNEEHASSRQDLCTRTLPALALAPLVVIALTLATPAAAQYGSYEPGAPTGTTSIDPSVQDAIDEAADELYEQLFTELSEDVELVSGCSIILEPADPIGSSCSCNASGAGATCVRNRFPNGAIRNVVCTDAVGTTTCDYNGPANNRKSSCRCF